MDKMKALKYMGPGRLELVEEPIPQPREGEVLLRIGACGICGSDVHGAQGRTGRRVAPMTMGHEFAGEVVSCSKSAGCFQPGDRVIAYPIHFCGACEMCRQGLECMCLNKRFFGVLTENGAMAEYLAVPEKLLFPLSDACTFAEGALAEPYAVAYGAVSRVDNLAGKRVLILGMGMIGLCILQLVKRQNPAQIIVSDLSESRLALALSLGADCAINPGREDFLAALEGHTGGNLADVSFEAVGVEPTANQSIIALKPRGIAVWVGMSARQMTINMQDIVCSARTVIGSFNYTFRDFGEVVKLLGDKALETQRLISKTVPLEEAASMFQALGEDPGAYTKVIIRPHASGEARGSGRP